MKNRLKLYLLAACLAGHGLAMAQSKEEMEVIRPLHYTQDKGDFLLKTGKLRFNRALYGDNRASRVEAGDLPEFALYLPGMGGNLQFVLESAGQRKKLIDAAHIETRYRAGSMLYRIQDPFLGKGSLEIQVLAQAEEEGLILQWQGKQLPKNTAVYVLYGGASGTSFSRNGDIGADPESGFYLTEAHAKGNRFELKKNSFDLHFTGRKGQAQQLAGSFSGTPALATANASALDDLTKLRAPLNSDAPMAYAYYTDLSKPQWVSISKGSLKTRPLQQVFQQAEKKRQEMLSRVQLHTPDSLINTMAGALVMAADGVWESPTFLHGAVAWRMPLNAWRGASVADALGWHDRARTHFNAYSQSQVLEPATAAVEMDTALHLARHVERMGTAMFSSGYISRNPNNNRIAHHYDMNLVFFDQLLTHFNHTGDLGYIRQLWPYFERHLAWERRNFDRDKDGLYDAYCAIWASDGLQYSGGGVSHTSAYNLRANRFAAKLCGLLGIDASLYQQEADKIEKALKSRLWLADQGHFAEFQDALGNKLLHKTPGLWTIYHTADAHFLNPFEHYQQIQYVHQHIPKIPIRVAGMEGQGLYTLASTNWQPYTWSVNNVALAENLHTALAFWQGGSKEDAYVLWRSNLLESMYFGKSPGNFHQLSHYDAVRGELYRDFADPIAMAARSLVEGLFGVEPHLLDQEIRIRPGFPRDWKEASLRVPQWQYDYQKQGDKLTLAFRQEYGQDLALRLAIPVDFQTIQSVTLNGKPLAWSWKTDAVGQPMLLIDCPKGQDFKLEIQGSGHWQAFASDSYALAYSDVWDLPLQPQEQLLEIYDPQGLVQQKQGKTIQFKSQERQGTFFVKAKQGTSEAWHAVNVALGHAIQHQFHKDSQGHHLQLSNRSQVSQTVQLQLGNWQQTLELKPGAAERLNIPQASLNRGTNRISLSVGQDKQVLDLFDWDLPHAGHIKTQDISASYNGRAQAIFQQQYLSPRPEGPTLQLPWQGIGNWCYPLTQAELDDSGLMQARKANVLQVLDIPFLIQGEQQNIAFCSQWDNYPTSLTIPVSVGKAKKAYLLMAGSTNPMQSQMEQGYVSIQYKDGSQDSLVLHNPTNWWPIEQDYYDNGYAFELADSQIPYRVQLKNGEVYRGGQLPQYSSIKGFTTRAVEGGAATLLDLTLNPTKEIQSISLRAHCNDVVIGLMAVSFLTD